MGKIKELLETRLDINKYQMLDVMRAIRDAKTYEEMRLAILKNKIMVDEIEKL